MTKQVQKGGNHSTNVQVGSLSVDGLTYSDARQIAVDVMKSELVSLSQEAEKIAAERIEVFADRLLFRLEEQPELLYRFHEPRTQISVRDAHRMFAKRGDEMILDISIDVLADYIACRPDDFKSVVLEDALKAIHSLTTGQINCLSILFICRYYPIEVSSPEVFFEALNRVCDPLIDMATSSASQIDYIVGLGCGDYEVIGQSLGNSLNRRFGGISYMLLQKQQSGELVQSAAAKKLSNRAKYGKVNRIIPEEFESILSDFSPTLRKLVTYWNSTNLKKINLRIVGKAIAVANIKLHFPQLLIDDSTWFDDAEILTSDADS